jgi:hypothetical protein
MDYRKLFRWPHADSRCSYFNPDLESAHAKYTDYLRAYLPQLLKPFGATLDIGYMDPAKRTSYAGWAMALAVQNRPEILSFTADRVLVEDSKPVRLTWNVRGQGRLELKGIGDVTGRTFHDAHVRRDTQFSLVFTPDSGQPIETFTHVLVSKQAPVIHRFSCDRAFVSDAKPVNLRWNVTGAERITIDNGIGDVTRCTSFQAPVRKDTLFTLTAISQFGAVSVATSQVSVSRRQPKISFFRTRTHSSHGCAQVELSWKVSNDAARVTITGVGDVTNIGTMNVDPSVGGSYHLIATSVFGFSAFARVCAKASEDPNSSNSQERSIFLQARTARQNWFRR